MLLDGIELNARRPLRWNPPHAKGSTQIAECDQSGSMVVPPVDHDCSLQKIVTDLADRLAKLEHENAHLKKTLLGPRSERSELPRVKVGEPTTPEQAKATRRARAEAKLKPQP